METVLGGGDGRAEGGQRLEDGPHPVVDVEFGEGDQVTQPEVDVDQRHFDLVLEGTLFGAGQVAYLVQGGTMLLAKEVENVATGTPRYEATELANLGRSCMGIGALTSGQYCRMKGQPVVGW